MQYRTSEKQAMHNFKCDVFREVVSDVNGRVNQHTKSLVCEEADKCAAKEMGVEGYGYRRPALRQEFSVEMDLQG